MKVQSYIGHEVRDVSGLYSIDPDGSRIGFEARHAMVTKVHGAFHEFTGSAMLDGQDPSNCKVELVIEVASLGTGNNRRDDHLRTNDFFDAARYPQIRFVSTGVRRLRPSVFELTGDLTIKGTTKSISVDFEFTGAVTDPWGNHCVGFEGRTTIHRRDWGVNFNATLEAGGLLVSENIDLILDISAVKWLEPPGAHHSGRPVDADDEELVVPVIPAAHRFYAQLDD
jgi:polyisoprenoid-binding protein YceI